MQKKSWRNNAGTVFSTEKRSAIGSKGMIVTNNPLGSAAGAEMFAAGGNAIDAAIASLFALTVVEPMMVGVFGAGMSTIRQASGEHSTINNYSVAPGAATPDMYKTLSDEWPDYQVVENRANDIGPLAVGVPGNLKGWCETLAKFGSLSLEDVMQPAIRYATRGYVATPYLCEIIRRIEPDIAGNAETAKTFIPDGQRLKPGDRVIPSEYADTLRLIAKQGPAVLYNGELGSVAVEHIQQTGGIITQQDLLDYRTVSADVIRGNYRDYDLVAPPPPTAGGVHVVEMLNILEAYDLTAMGFGSVDSVHLLAEVLKIGFEDRNQYTGDPAFVDVPIAMLIDKEFAHKRRLEINMASAGVFNTAYQRESNHTTHLTAADDEGNVIAATHTIHAAFGSKVTVPGTGMLLNNTMNIFDPHPGTANSIEPGKRVTSSMSPIIVEKNGKPVFALGLVGGTRIFPSALQAIVNLIDHGMRPQEAVEAPRIWTLGEALEMEKGYGADIHTGLADRGHHIEELKVIGGGMGMIAFDGDDLIGASCWRADGTPIGVAGGMARGGIRFEI
ncbi:MAG: gamma-glutamyltransferase [bacterium]|nr:gamma-glutamyltransferase [Gammaproteobacteria bacterium]